MSLRLGIDVGGTNLRVGVFDGLNLLHQQRANADFKGLCLAHDAHTAWQMIVHALAEQIKQTRQSYPSIAEVGIGFPGFICPQSKAILLSPNLPGLNKVNLIQPLQDQTGLPIRIENDALCAAYSEYHLSGLQSPASLLFIGLGTGVGGGMISHGKPFPGDHGVAMEFGHVIVEPNGRLCGCGNHGCLEQYASAGGVQQSYAQNTGQQLMADEIASLAEQGDKFAIDAYAQAGRYLGMAIAHAAKIVDIQHITLGGGVMNAASLILPSLHQQLTQDLIPVLRGALNIRVSTADDIAGMLGAALLNR